MEIAEIKDLLNKMNAFAEDGDSLDSTALMQDPIVLNRLAVELLQQIDRDAKPELVIAPEGIESYFGYSVALAVLRARFRKDVYGRNRSIESHRRALHAHRGF